MLNTLQVQVMAGELIFVYDDLDFLWEARKTQLHRIANDCLHGILRDFELQLDFTMS